MDFVKRKLGLKPLLATYNGNNYLDIGWQNMMQWVGEYVRWYLEGLDRRLCRDDALNRATRNYADKWGEDKVVRGP